MQAGDADVDHELGRAPEVARGQAASRATGRSAQACSAASTATSPAAARRRRSGGHASSPASGVVERRPAVRRRGRPPRAPRRARVNRAARTGDHSGPRAAITADLLRRSCPRSRSPPGSRDARPRPRSSSAYAAEPALRAARLRLGHRVAGLAAGYSASARAGRATASRPGPARRTGTRRATTAAPDRRPQRLGHRSAGRGHGLGQLDAGRSRRGAAPGRSAEPGAPQPGLRLRRSGAASSGVTRVAVRDAARRGTARPPCPRTGSDRARAASRAHAAALVAAPASASGRSTPVIATAARQPGRSGPVARRRRFSPYATASSPCAAATLGVDGREAARPCRGSSRSGAVGPCAQPPIALARLHLDAGAAPIEAADHGGRSARSSPARLGDTPSRATTRSGPEHSGRTAASQQDRRVHPAGRTPRPTGRCRSAGPPARPAWLKSFSRRSPDG